jgi:diguanylate cyclase (GGDEF)-like protein
MDLSVDAGRITATDVFVASLAQRLATARSGVGFVYETLDDVVSRLGLSDAVLVTESATLGRQVFRVGRRPLDTTWARLAGASVRGLYGPEGVPGDLAVAAVSMAEIALRLDALEHDASHDGLTGLLNRRSFDHYLAEALGRATRYGWRFALVLMDLNRFKSLNDRHGHAAGDEVLRLLGTELRRTLRVGDAAARVGGDEFAVVLHNGDIDGGHMLAARLMAALDHELPWADVSFSVGVAVAPAESSDTDQLRRLADARLYDAKVTRSP